MKTVYLLQHRSSYGGDTKVIRAYDSETAAQVDADAFGSLVRSGSLEVVQVPLVTDGLSGFGPAPVFDMRPKAALP